MNSLLNDTATHLQRTSGADDDLGRPTYTWIEQGTIKGRLAATKETEVLDGLEIVVTRFKFYTKDEVHPEDRLTIDGTTYNVKEAIPKKTASSIHHYECILTGTS